MGTDQSKKLQSEQDSSHKIPHDKFATVKHIPNSDLLQITLPIESEADLNRWVSDVKKTNDFDKQSLLLQTKHEFTGRGFCGSSGILKVYFENYPYVFQEEMENRALKQNYFEQEELWYLLYSLVSASKDFAKINTKVGDIRPYNIFINEEGHIKLANSFSWPYEKTNFDKTAFEKQKTFLSPEEMALISRGCLQNNTDPIVSESFSIGLTMLQAGTLYDFEDIYSTKHGEINLNFLQQKLQEWMSSKNQYGQTPQYSPILKNIVKNMCEIDPSKRQTSLEVQNMLRPYAESILHLVSFNYNQVNTPQHQSRNQSNSKPQELKTFQGAPPQGGSMFKPQPQPQFIINDQQKQPIGVSPYISQAVSQFEEKKPAWNSNQQPIQPPIAFQQQQAPQYSYNSNNFAYSNAVPYIAGRPLANLPSQPQSNIIVNQNPVKFVQPSQPPQFTFNDGHQEHFQKYSAPPPPPSQIITVSNQETDKFNPLNRVTQSNFNQHPVYTSLYVPPPEVKPYNSKNVENKETGTTGTATYTSTFTSTSYQASSNPPIIDSTPAPDYSSTNDILKKIDEQLKASRKLFPSP